jgi:hypothetical protein
MFKLKFVTLAVIAFASSATHAQSSSGTNSQSDVLVRRAAITSAVQDNRNFDPKSFQGQENISGVGSVISGGDLQKLPSLGGDSSSGGLGLNNFLGDLGKYGTVIGAAVGGKTGAIIGGVSSGANTIGKITDGGWDSLTWREGVNIANVGIQTYAAVSGDEKAQQWGRVSNLGTGLVNNGVVDKAIDRFQGNTPAQGQYPNQQGQYPGAYPGTVGNNGGYSAAYPGTVGYNGGYSTQYPGTVGTNQNNQTKAPLFNVAGIDVSSKDARDIVKGTYYAVAKDDTTRLATAGGNLAGNQFNIQGGGQITNAMLGQKPNTNVSGSERAVNTATASLNVLGQNYGAGTTFPAGPSVSAPDPKKELERKIVGSVKDAWKNRSATPTTPPTTTPPPEGDPGE